ncbi:MAG: hypothetical protein ACRC53_04580 [Plesiomonas sp.]|uniref:hypothetical protein n=1 Tax=Plesiomonas sp. TaxID=2486279 RepID=UPI003F3E46B4
MTSSTTTLTEQQMTAIDQLARKQVDDMNSDEILWHSVEQYMGNMTEHMKDYFLARVHFHRNTHRQS